jgi:LPXTG-motif cell wall-anchored protein
MDKETGKAISANGAVLTATTTFTPTEANGTVTVKFNFDSSTCDGRSIVVFEDLMIGETIVATHSDLTDENQTVAFEKATPNTDAKTGDNYTPIIATMIVALGAGAGAAVLLGKKKKENED